MKTWKHWIGICCLAVLPCLSQAEDLDRKQLEKQFENDLTEATFVGTFNIIEDGQPGPVRREKYTIQGVQKGEGDLWIITARIQYGQTDVAVPIPVRVLWAGDTPVITLTRLSIPGVGTYTARVLIYDGTYAGTWSGGKHGGLMSGVIQHKPAADKAP